MPVTIPKPDLRWDTCEIAQNQAKVWALNGEWPDKTEDELFSMACEDYELYELSWEHLLECLKEHMNKVNPDGEEWRVTVEGFGWRGLSGHTTIDANDPAKFLRKVLPDTDNTFEVYVGGGKILIHNWHHDSPVRGEWYTCKPVLSHDYLVEADVLVDDIREAIEGIAVKYWGFDADRIERLCKVYKKAKARQERRERKNRGDE